MWSFSNIQKLLWMSIDLTHYDFLEQERRNLRLNPVYTRITKIKRSLIIVR